MDEFGLPTSFGRKTGTRSAVTAQKPPGQKAPRLQLATMAPRKQNQQGVRTSPYPPQGGASAPAGDSAQTERFQGQPRGRGRGRGGGNNRGRGGARGGDDARGPPPGQRAGFSAQETETGKAFYSESFFENPWAALESKA